MKSPRRLLRAWPIADVGDEMTAALFLEQLVNGVQLGTMLFLMSAGLTLTFGVMNFLNLTHGSFYMLGAFFAATMAAWTGNFLFAVILAIICTLLVGALLDLVIFRHLYNRSHLDQVLATFGLLLAFNDLVILIWGREPLFVAIPPTLSGAIEISPGNSYPLYRLAITVAGLATALLIWLLITRTRLGMLIRAGASNREMVGALGVNIAILFSLVFGLGAAAAGFAGAMTGPLIAVQTGMGDEILIIAFVVVVVGGISSVQGTFVASLAIGIVDTMGRFLLPKLLGFTVGPALASMAIYVLMAVILLTRPRGSIAARAH
jgi:branched-chain amino acid transport system permease protein